MGIREQGKRTTVEASHMEQWVNKHQARMPIPQIGERHLALWETTGIKKPKRLYAETIVNGSQTLAAHTTYQGSAAVIEMHYASEGQYIYPTNHDLGLPAEQSLEALSQPQFRLLFMDARRQVEYIATYSEGKLSLVLLPLIKSTSNMVFSLSNIDAQNYDISEAVYTGRVGARRVAPEKLTEPIIQTNIPLRVPTTFTQGQHTLFIAEAVRPNTGSDSFIQSIANLGNLVQTIKSYEEQKTGVQSIFEQDTPSDERFISITKRLITPELSHLVSSLTVPLALDEASLVRDIASPDDLAAIIRGLRVFIEGHYSEHKS